MTNVPQTSETLLRQAHLAMVRGDFDSARAILEPMTLREPDNQDARRLLEEVKNRRAASIDAGTESIDLAPAMRFDTSAGRAAALVVGVMLTVVGALGLQWALSGAPLWWLAIVMGLALICGIALLGKLVYAWINRPRDGWDV